MLFYFWEVIAFPFLGILAFQSWFINNLEMTFLEYKSLCTFEYFFRSPRCGITGLKMSIHKAFHTYCWLSLGKNIFISYFDRICSPWVLTNIQYFITFASLCLIFYLGDLLFPIGINSVFHMCSVGHIFSLVYLLKKTLRCFRCTKVENYFLRTNHNSNMYLQNKVDLGKVHPCGKNEAFPFYTEPIQSQTQWSLLPNNI